VINNLGHAYFRQGDFLSAEQWLQWTLTMAPGRSSAWANLGLVHARQGDGNKAVAYLANAYRFARNQDATRRVLQALRI
jgi:Tfp pilus assembly protein PilF